MRQQAAALIAEAGDAAEAAEEAADSATQTAADIAALTGQAGDLLDEAEEVLTQAQAAAAAIAQADARIRALETLTGLQNKRLANLFALHAGRELTTLTDSTLASQKTVPAGALPYATLSVIGGQSGVVNGAVVHRPVDVVLSQGDTDFETIIVPQAVRALEGYGVGVNGNCFNALDLERRRFLRRIGTVDLGTLTWRYTGDGNGCFYAYLNNGKKSQNANGLCAGYQATPVFPTALNDLRFVLGSPYITNASGSIALRDDSFNGNATAFKAAMQGNILYYELNSAVETDLSAVLSEDDLIGVEPGGTITFCAANEDVAVPSTVVYALRSGTGSSPSA